MVQALSVEQWLRVWEGGRGLPGIQRSLLILTAACPDSSPDELVHWPLGRRDTALLDLRDLTFGKQLNSLVACPNCKEQMELSFTTSQIRDHLTAQLGGALASESLEVAAFGWQVRFRLPDSMDLDAISRLNDLSAARSELLRRCLISAKPAMEMPSGDVVVEQAGGIPLAVEQALVEAMASADPQALTEIDITCLACSHVWQVTFDITEYLWIELESWASRMLREVHTLALAYGWRQGDILAMSQARRQAYLALLTGGG